ncbi:acyl carrier protein [Povalibacter sp.]|uniref:acyl carrier protein n=1 Tax=Povalibacter sp. TaxID=1962978 RepID=UPI002F42196C
MQTDDEILERVRATLVDLFELDPAVIAPQARLADDLEIDSIDVVDLMEQVRWFTGRKVTPEDFRSVRTVADLIAVVRRLQAN